MPSQARLVDPTALPATAQRDPEPGARLVRRAGPAGVGAAAANAHYYALATVCIGAFMGQLDASIVTVAFPTLQRVFDARVDSVTWVGLSYLIVLVAGVTAVGRVADMVGRKLLYVYGFVVFILGSALCALAPGLLASTSSGCSRPSERPCSRPTASPSSTWPCPDERLGRGSASKVPPRHSGSPSGRSSVGCCWPPGAGGSSSS